MEDPKLREQQQRYDRGWRKGLEKGKEQRGNLESNLEFLEKIKLLKSTDRILEIGCGIGLVVNELTKKGYDIAGTDISTEAIEYGRKKFPEINLKVHAAERLPYDDESFDVVLSFDLFEHISEIDKHISQVYRVLKNRGYYLFQTPHKYFSATFDTLSSMSFRWRKSHPSLHTPGQLKRRLKSQGFSVKFVKVNPVTDFTIRKMQKLGFLAKIYSKINFQKLPICLQPNLYVIAQKTGKN
ncbi:MAG: class I SAM-dependent methyltransferase [Sedimentisphaerales bacterium]|nr:class I SAM-dependent methyltransferase [Sedimentisphaerales bacterium]